MEKTACGWIATLSGAVDGWAPTGAGPSGRARWRNESLADMVARRRRSRWRRVAGQAGGG